MLPISSNSSSSGGEIGALGAAPSAASTASRANLLTSDSSFSLCTSSVKRLMHSSVWARVFPRQPLQPGVSLNFRKIRNCQNNDFGIYRQWYTLYGVWLLGLQEQLCHPPEGMGLPEVLSLGFQTSPHPDLPSTPCHEHFNIEFGFWDINGSGCTFGPKSLIVQNSDNISISKTGINTPTNKQTNLGPYWVPKFS